MTPLICTSNTQSHVDYGIPLHARKSTDYRTCTGTYHRYIPNFPQHFDCRVKPKIEKDLLDKDIAIRDDVITVYDKEFYYKHNQDDAATKAIGFVPLENVKYIRNAQEKYYQHASSPWKPGISEMKDTFDQKVIYRENEIAPPAVHGYCPITGLERPLQPQIPPEQHGFWKYLDIYMTDNRLNYAPYSQEQRENAQKDIITFYTGSGQYKELVNVLPGKLTGNKSVYDKALFRQQYPNKFLSRAPKRVPNFGMQTESRTNYQHQTFSDLYPYINQNGIVFEDSLSGASPWQNYCPPGMYCTEQCHIGTGWPVRSVVKIGKDDGNIIHTPCNETIKQEC